MPILFVKFKREVPFPGRGICPPGCCQDRARSVLDSLCSGRSTSQLTFSSGTAVLSTVEPGYGDVLAFLWGVSAAPSETDMVKSGGNPRDENGLQPTEMSGQLLGLTATEAKATERETRSSKPLPGSVQPSIAQRPAGISAGASGVALPTALAGRLALNVWPTVQLGRVGWGDAPRLQRSAPFGPSSRQYFTVKDFNVW